MSRSPLFLASLLLAAPAQAGGLLAIRVGRAETASRGVIENAVILVEDGKIVTIGEDLPVERGVPILDRPGWTAMPGIVSAYTRLGQDSEGADEMSPEVTAKDEIWPGARDLRKVVEYGVTTLGVYPAGNGIPGQATAIRPLGETVDEMVLKDGAYLKIVLRADSASKKRVRDGFKKADEHQEKVRKALEKWEKDKDKKAPAKKDEKKEEKPEEKKDEKKLAQDPDAPPEAERAEAALDEPDPEGATKADPKFEAKLKKAKEAGFVPPAPDEKSSAFVALRAGELRALVSISSAAEYLHWLHALGEEKIGWDLRIVLNQDSDVFYVLDKATYDLAADGIGDRKLRAVVEPLLTMQPNTRRIRNLPMELTRAGAKVCFTPRFDDLGNYKLLLQHVGEVVGAGLARDAAIRGLTLEPAELLGIGERVGSLDKGKDANLVFLDGDPFQPATRIQAVMLDGRFVHGEVDQ